MASPLGLAPFIENIIFIFFERLSLDTEKTEVTVLRTFGKKHYGIPINGASPNGLAIDYFNQLFCQSTQYRSNFLIKTDISHNYF
jgi:hypothetical protein